jgi:hypothetical protein
LLGSHAGLFAAMLVSHNSVTAGKSTTSLTWDFANHLPGMPRCRLTALGFSSAKQDNSMAPLKPMPLAMRFLALMIGAAVMLAGCAQGPSLPAASQPRAAAHVRPKAPTDWFHQQLAAARAAKRAHQPRTDTVGAQQAYDDIMRAACTRAAVAGPDKYPARCDAVLRRVPVRSPSDPFACEDDVDDPVAQAACSD